MRRSFSSRKELLSLSQAHSFRGPAMRARSYRLILFRTVSPKLLANFWVSVLLSQLVLGVLRQRMLSLTLVFPLSAWQSLVAGAMWKHSVNITFDGGQCRINSGWRLVVLRRSAHRHRHQSPRFLLPHHFHLYLLPLYHHLLLRCLLLNSVVQIVSDTHQRGSKSDVKACIDSKASSEDVRKFSEFMMENYP